jgi:dihydroneopterin aldolase
MTSQESLTDRHLLTVSLHGIRIYAFVGVYDEEKILGNDFEVDIDVHLPAKTGTPWPFADYTRINTLAREAFAEPTYLLEDVIQRLHASLKGTFEDAEKIRVAVRKLHPPMPGQVAYAQVAYEG